MKIHLIAVGTKMPAWVQTGFETYAARMPPECRLVLHEIQSGARGKNLAPARAIAEESQKILAAIPKNAHIIALEVGGKNWTSEQCAVQLENWLAGGQDVALLVGGADGLSDECRAAAHAQWSLSPLTLPHPLVRLVLAEQIYRAWTIRQGHPYHRG